MVVPCRMYKASGIIMHNLIIFNLLIELETLESECERYTIEQKQNLHFKLYLVDVNYYNTVKNKHQSIRTVL